MTILGDFWSGLEIQKYPKSFRFFLFLRRNHGPKSLSPNFRAEKQIFSRASFSANFGATSGRCQQLTPPESRKIRNFRKIFKNFHENFEVVQGLVSASYIIL